MKPVQYNPLSPKLYLSRIPLPLRPRVTTPDNTVKCLQYLPQDPPLDQEPEANIPDSAIKSVTFRSEPSEAVLSLRHYVAQDLAMCRKIIVTLELTRMRKARLGLQNWILFWRQIYDANLARTITLVVSTVYMELDQLFRATAQNMCHITYNIGKRMALLRTVHEARAVWHQMEQQIVRWRNIRRSRAQKIFHDLRLDLENIPVDVPEMLFDDLKRGIFALDPFGDYHPGDAEAEEKDKQADGKACAEDYVNQQPDLPSRPGFSNEFHMALQAASAGFDDNYSDPEEPEDSDSDMSSILHIE
ncbi:predicted protein [Uncinocarpus reesii 1704]|uniref:Uncharacterized protein n=1 Tax=Uncinocarpus reesii (strain UAMH 1704) TaxID=336963 RepID=C4JIW6_UNCRE|nr:uncharacterized protein UREG_01573 [Uncinocarpus reesii 1704]EEP76724.1 predicted protein [Uncinocarpus reesii 1704]